MLLGVLLGVMVLQLADCGGRDRRRGHLMMVMMVMVGMMMLMLLLLMLLLVLLMLLMLLVLRVLREVRARVGVRLGMRVRQAVRA